MKKILVLSSFPAGYRINVFKGLAEKYDLTVLFGSASNENRNPDWFVKSEEFRYYLVDTKEGADFAKKCFKELNKFDLVLGYDWYQTWALKFELKAIRLKIPYVINCEGAFIGKFNPKDIVKRFFVSHASACLAGGEYAKKYFMHYGAKPENIHVHNFTSLYDKDILSDTLTDSEKKDLRNELGLGDEKTVLSIGQFIPRKGFDILLEAWKELNDPEARLLLIGGGDLRAEYERMIEDENIKNVEIIDFVPFEKIFKYYMASDVFALATREDIWGLIVNEAMANAVPVLISDKCIAGLEMIVEGKNGYIVKDNSIENWVSALRDCLQNSEKRRELAANGLKTVKEFTIENTIAGDMAAIDKLL